MQKLSDLRTEADEAYDQFWFIQSIEEIERTDISLSLRLYIRNGLFVQVFMGEKTGSLYFALIEHEHRIFGIDRERGIWHLHPFDAPETHQPLLDGIEPKPLLTFLSQVETLLIEQELL